MGWSDAARAAAAEARKFKSSGHVPGTRGSTRRSFAHSLKIMRRFRSAKHYSSVSARNADARAAATTLERKQNASYAKQVKREAAEWGTLPGGQKVR